MLILDLWGISLHAVAVFGLGKNLLFKYVLGHCVREFMKEKKMPKSPQRRSWEKGKSFNSPAHLDRCGVFSN